MRYSVSNVSEKQRDIQAAPLTFVGHLVNWPCRSHSERHKILRFAQYDTWSRPYPVDVFLSGGESEVVS